MASSIGNLWAAWFRRSMLAVALAAPFLQAQAAPLYTVNVRTGELVVVDSGTGVANVVGALGRSVPDIDLATTLDGRLWGLASSGVGAVQLWELSTLSGAVLSSVDVHDGALSVLIAEGLAARGNTLMISYSRVGGSASRVLGEVGADGSIIGGIDGGTDLDALADGGANLSSLYAIDREPGSATHLYGVDHVTAINTLIASYSDALGFHDLVTFNDGSGFMLDTFTGTLQQVNLGTGAFIGAGLRVGGAASVDYNGLAIAQGLVSTPSTLSLLALALGVLVLRGGRRCAA